MNIVRFLVQGLTGAALALSVPACPGLVWEAGAAEAATVLAVTPEAWVERGGEKIALGPKTALNAADTVITDATGKVQILFADDSAVTVSPSSTLRIADFAYEPEGQGGRETLELGRGMARFLTGEVAKRHPEGYSVHTLHATVGVRGTMFTVRAGTDVTTVILQETGGTGLVVTNLGTGAINSLGTPGRALDVGPQGTTERAATPEETAAALSATRDVGVGSGSRNDGNPGLMVGLGPEGPAVESALLWQDSDVPLPEPGLDVDAIRGAFAAAGVGWLAQFKVNAAAAISDGSLTVTRAFPVTGYGLMGDWLSYVGGNGSIGTNGAFSLSGFNLGPGMDEDNSSSTWQLLMDGRFADQSSGTLNWSIRETGGDEGMPLDPALQAGASGAFGPDLAPGGLYADFIRGSFCATGTDSLGYEWNAGFRVDSAAAISNAVLWGIQGDNTMAYDFGNGNGAISQDGTFVVNGLQRMGDANDTGWNATMDGRFQTLDQGTLNWALTNESGGANTAPVPAPVTGAPFSRP